MSNENPFEDPFEQPKKQESQEDIQHFSSDQPVNPGTSQFSGGYQETLPNSTGVLVLGILGIVFSFCYAIPGIILSIIGLSMAGGADRRYKADPNRYTVSSYNNLKAGRICGYIGLGLSILMLIIFVIYIIWYVNMMNSVMRYDWRY